MALTEEQKELIDTELCTLSREGRFSEMSDRAIAVHMLSKYEPELTNSATGKPYDERTIRTYIDRFIDNWFKDGKAFRRAVTKKLMHASHSLANDAAKNPQAYKVLSDKFLPDKEKESDGKPALSPGAITILQREGVGTAILIGQGAGVEAIRDSGHECIDTVHSMAPEQEADIGLRTVPCGHDTAVRGGDTGGHEGDMAEGIAVPDTPGSPEDTDNNDSGGDLDAS